MDNRKKINIFVPEREVILENDLKLYVLFTFEENGDVYSILTDGEALYWFKEQNDDFLIIEDEGEIDILVDIVDNFAKEYYVLDRDGKSDLMKKLIGEDEINELGDEQ